MAERGFKDMTKNMKDLRQHYADIVREADPELAAVILNKDNCYSGIAEAVKNSLARELLRDSVHDSETAYCWARNIGDREIMRDRVIEPQWIELWNEEMPDYKIDLEK